MPGQEGAEAEGRKGRTTGRVGVSRLRGRHSAGPQGRQRGRRPQSRVTGEPQALPVRFPVWEGIGAWVWPSEPQFWETEETSGETRLTTGQTEEQSRLVPPLTPPDGMARSQGVD